MKILDSHNKIEATHIPEKSSRGVKSPRKSIPDSHNPAPAFRVVHLGAKHTTETSKKGTGDYRQGY